LFLGNGYQIVDSDSSSDEVKDLLAKDVARYGGWILGSFARKEWPDYFPHVSAELIAAGFYDWMEAWQGYRATYFVGSSLTFESLEHTARQARDVVERHFGK